jgi:hypothetical protein
MIIFSPFIVAIFHGCNPSKIGMNFGYTVVIMLLRISSATLILTVALYLTHMAAQALQSEASRATLVNANLLSKHFGTAANDEVLVSSTRTDAQASPAKSASEQEQQKKKQNQPAFEILQGFESGQRTSSEIREEIAMLAGDTAPIAWGNVKIDQPLRLSAILSHVRNLENNFEILTLHTLSADGRPDDVVTHYTSRISEADQKNIHSALIVAHKLEQKKGIVRFSEKPKQTYNFYLAPQTLAGSFRLQKPQGAFTFSEATANTFDPLALLADNFGQIQEIEDGTFEVSIADQIFLVTMTVRQTDLETVTIEIEMREKDSINSQSFILIYE